MSFTVALLRAKSLTRAHCVKTVTRDRELLQPLIYILLKSLEQSSKLGSQNIAVASRQTDKQFNSTFVFHHFFIL